MNALYRFQPGTSPLLVNVPHAGLEVPRELWRRFSPAGMALADTDWFVDQLYAMAPALGAGLMVATHSRYVVDLNRPPDDAALYATRGTGLVPVETFGRVPLYDPGQLPDAAEIAERCEAYWRPYHARIELELERLRQRHGHAILLDGHSIRGEVPALFKGVLPDLNLGSHGGRSASAGLIDRVMLLLRAAQEYSSVLDGRFQGGYITRHYGRPDQGVHALQLEISQRSYMRETPPLRDPARMQRLRALLARLLQLLVEWKPG